MPLAETYRRLVRLCEALRVTVLDGAPPADPAGGTWLSAAELAASPQAVEAAVDGASARILAEHGRSAPPHVAASRLLHDHLWSASLLVSGPWYLTGRVTRLSPDRLWAQPATGALALVPDDVREPRAPDGPEALRAAVAAYARPLLHAFGARTRRGPRALWGMAEDDLVSGIWYLGRALGEEARALLVADSVVPGGAGFRSLRAASGRSYPTRTRAGCCLYYTIRPVDTCLTCPRLGDAERLRRLAAEPDKQRRVAIAEG
jgi:hypothetical protein